MATTYEAIATVTVGSSGAANIEFTSIPADWTDLLVKLSSRTARNTYQDVIAIYFNSSTSNISMRYLEGDGTAYSGSSASYIWVRTAAATATANTFGNAEFYIPNYAGSTNKSVSADGVSENNSSSAVTGLTAGLWSNTAAITSIKLESANTENFVQYSTATLYGIKNS
jgi:hypothetical protein